MPRQPATAFSPPSSRRYAWALAAALAAVIPPTAGPEAADLPPPLMARFTKTVQPLLLNKCAAGACHGGPTAHPPRLHRGDGAGRIDRQITLANIEAVTSLVPAGHDAAALLVTISGRHPADASATMPTAVPLTTQERATLESWLTAALAGNAARPAPRPAPQPNRFRAMLDAAANPPPLPPPQEPAGVILNADGEPRRAGR